MSAPAHGKPIVGYDQVNTSVITRREKTPVDRLPAWSDVLAVVAHPDDESFGLGALLAAFVAAGVRVSVLCLTHGEASTLHGVEGDLSQALPGVELLGPYEHTRWQDRPRM